MRFQSLSVEPRTHSKRLGVLSRKPGQVCPKQKENQMMRPELLKKLDALFDELERTRAWGNVAIEYRDGVANMLRTTRNEKLQTQENTRAYNHRNFR
jgi:hypothetical protein